MDQGTISACYVSGGSSIGENSAWVGGLVGVYGVSNSTISTCYVKGRRSTGGTSADVGGLVGFQGGSTRACYVSNITVEGSGANVGSLVGNHSGGTINACYAGGKDYGISIKGTGSGTVTNSYNQIATGGTEVGPDKFETTLKTLQAIQAFMPIGI